MGTFDGQVVLVTGAGAGIGRATALAFAEAGAHVAVSDLDADRANAVADQISQDGGTATPFTVDVSDGAAVESLIATIADTIGPLDCACNNAGIEGARGTTASYEEAEWDRVMNTNLRGVWLCMKHEIRHMKSRGGAIVNVASAFGTVGLPKGPARAAADHGVIGLTRSAALECAEDGIRINAVCPSFVETDLQMRAGPLIHPEERQEVVESHPMRRFGTANEVADAVLWLASDAASFVTGHPLLIDGGYTAR